MVVIRTAQIEDFKFLSKIFALNVPKYFEKKELDDFKKYFIKNFNTYSILILNSEIIGGAGYVMENELTGRITWLFIHPDFHRKGFGKKIVAYCMNKLRDVKSIEKIEVNTSNLAFNFFKNLEFELEYVKKNHWAQGIDLYFMSRKISYKLLNKKCL